MKTTTGLLFCIFLLFNLGFTPKHPHGNGNYVVDSQKSKIEWKGEKLTGDHSGTIQLKSGNISIQNHMASNGSFVIDMNTINCTDMEGDSKQNLEDHLKDDDFFSVSKFPESSFKITGCTPLRDENGNNCTIKGNLTIKGITNEISFPALITISGHTLNAKAEMKFDRTKWDIKYKSKTVFDDLGDKFIYDDITMTLNLIGNISH